VHVHFLMIFIFLLTCPEGYIDETIQANQIMSHLSGCTVKPFSCNLGDLCDANDVLLSPNGDDCNLVTEAVMKAGDLSRHTYTQHDKMVLRQFEGAAWPAKNLSLFLQDKENTWTYVLFSL
jgi:hypothetical protein